MTSAQPMQPGHATALVRRRRAAAVAACVLGAGCSPTMRAPLRLATPYGESQLWAVAPFVNESGISTVDTNRVADIFTQQVQQVQGVDSVPVNRVLFALRELEMQGISSAGDALLLMNALDLDGLLVGTVTAYDPYPPLVLGVAVQLYLRPEVNRSRGFDPRSLTRSIGGTPTIGEWGPSPPTAQAAGIFDAANHQTLIWLREYSAHRSPPDSAYGADIYLVSMELYTQFVSYRLIHDLLVAEWTRLMPVALNQQR